MPPNSENSNTDQGLYGFGYDDKIDDFKLVRVSEVHTPIDSSDGYEDEFVIQIFRSIPNSDEVEVSWVRSESRVEIYTLGSNSWRTYECQDMPYYFYSGTKPEVVVNGALHWSADKKSEYYVAIVSFDMANETFKEVARLEGPMLHLVECDHHSIDSNSVAALGGCICILHKTYGVKVDVWVMQEYGVKESWTKRFTITLKSITETSDLEVICEFQNNEILFYTDDGLVYYDPNHNLPLFNANKPD
ncbi:F-box protein At3g07870-like [Papaver somniferum]|uniref:F-box protein At3g07870-like n=1 Tax=Papaver somniferum TaxID=3469 RepID=UPI000E704F2A|nr:F-box protein At3g07870-like [Papaver somniferum]